MAGQSRTEKPTPQRLREARLRGDIAVSPELIGSAVAIAGVVVLQQQGGRIVEDLQALLARDILLSGSRNLSAGELGARLAGDGWSALTMVFPIMAATTIGAVAIGIANTRGLLSLKPLQPSLRKLNPRNGVKHLASRESLVLLAKTLLKIAIVVAVVAAWQPAWTKLAPGLALVPAGAAAAQAWSDCVTMALQIMAAFFVVGALDFGYRYFSWYRRQRMTKEEVKEELRRSEGNPQMRARMRQRFRRRLQALIAGGGLRRVPQADVVITNPTHYAVAIQYKPGVMRAPKVIAKGQRLVALRIKEAARAHNVPIVENKPLAQALFKAVDVNGEIPADLYQAVAQVLAFVYRLRAPRRPLRRAAGARRRVVAR